MPLLTHPPGHSLAHLEIAVHMADLPNPMKHGKGLVKSGDDHAPVRRSYGEARTPDRLQIERR